jgi:beta-lactamase superfamily II metal-dependent hydrolase
MKTKPIHPRRSESAAPVLLAALLLCASAAHADPRMTAHFIDVGQGDATLLEFPCGAMLIDAGAQDADHVAALTHYLQAFFARRADLTNTLESVIITHNHLDHTRALRAVVENFRVRRYLDHGMLDGAGTGNPRWVRQQAAARAIAVREITDDQIPTTGDRQGLTDAQIDPLACAGCDPRISILAARRLEKGAWSEEDFENKNNESLVIRVAFGSTILLFTGDAEEPELEMLTERYQNTTTLDADVYHAGHHGSANATTAPLLAMVTPMIAIISVGQWNYGKGTLDRFTTWYYGHPRAQTVQLLANAIPYARARYTKEKLADKPMLFRNVQIRKAIYATAWDGHVKITATETSKFIIEPER